MNARKQAIDDFKSFLRKDEATRAGGITSPTPMDPQNGAAPEEGINPEPFDDEHMEALEDLLRSK